MNLKIKLNGTDIPNNMILDKLEFSEDIGVNDFTVGKFILPTMKTKIHNDIEVKHGDIFTVYLDDEKYHTYEPYEIKKGNMSREITAYGMPYFALTQTYQPSTTNYTTRSLLSELQTALNIVVVGFQDIVAVDMPNVEPDTAINLLQAVAMLLQSNVRINPHGEIEFIKVDTTTTHEIAQSQITSIVKSDTTDYHITQITGRLSEDDKNPIVVGASANAWNNLTLINPYLTQSVCTNILSSLPQYSGFDIKIFNAPVIKPLEKIKFTYQGVEYIIPVMDVTTSFSTGGLVTRIKANVSNANDKVNNYKGSLTTRLEVVKNITSELDTKVTVIDGSIGTLINKTDVIEGDITTINEQYSQINQTIGEIDLRVGQVQTELADKVSTDEIITSINLSNEGVKIQGDKVVLTGDTIIIGANGEQTITQFIKDEGENLLLKPNFNDGTLANWGYSVSSYIFVDTTHKHNNNTACKLKYTGKSNAIMLSTASMSIDKFESGKSYKVSMWIYVEDKTTLKGDFYFRVVGTGTGTSSAIVIAERLVTQDNLINNQWNEISFEFTAQQDYTKPTIRINACGIVAWVTDFSLQEQGGLSQTEIVKILNGAGDGLYLVDGELLINAEYIQTGAVRADLIKVNVDGATKNLLPFNYVTMDNAINTKFYINEDDNGYPYAECDLPIYSGGGSSDFVCVPFGYSDVNIEAGRHYWFSCEYYAQWNGDTKPDDGVGESTIGSGRHGTKTGNNLDIFLYNRDDIGKLNTGRNLLDNTDGRLYATLWTHPNQYQSSGFTVSYHQEWSQGLGYTMLTGSGDSTEEYYYRFVFPNPYDLQGLEAGCTYTLSGKVSGTMPNICIRHEWSKGDGWLDNTYYPILLKGEDNWIPFSYTFTIPSDATGFHLGFQSNDRIVKTICYLAHLKLEKSSKATSWCLSPTDKGEEIPTYVEESTPLCTLASVEDFNASINIVERENYEGVYQRGWTRLVGRIDATESYTGRLWINIDGSGFRAGDDGWFYLSKLQLVDAEESDENIELDYIQQVREKHIELTDGSYYTGTYSVDGIQLVEGTIQATSDTSKRKFEIDYEGFNFRSTTGSEDCFLGLGKAQYSYDAGSSGTIYGYDDLYGVGCRYLIEDTGDYEGIFCGVHKGFQIPNSTSYGRPDIYVRNRYSDRLDFDDWTDWSLLGAKVEPNALVRRNDNCSIATNGLVIQGDASNDDFKGGTVRHGSIIFSEPLYSTTGNGQIINVHKDNKGIYIGNHSSTTLIETEGALIISDSQNGERQALVSGIQTGDIQVDIYTSRSIEIWADRDSSSTTERVWIGAGGNGLTITSSATSQSFDSMRLNNAVVINTQNLHDKIYIGAQVSETGRNVHRTGVYSFNTWHDDLYQGHGGAYGFGGQYWSTLGWGNGTNGSAELAVNWTDGGNIIAFRSLRDVDTNWWNWKRIYHEGHQQTSTSDVRYKRAVSDVNTSDCYDMVKNTQLHHYLLLDNVDELRACSEDGIEELETELDSEGYSRKVQMGIIAQDVLKYECGKYFVVQDINKDDDGNITSDKYSIDAYNYASAILGGLQEEIRIRDNQYEELKQENEELKQRLARIEAMLNQ